MTGQPSGRPVDRRPATRWWLLLALVLAVAVTGTSLGLRAILASGREEPATAPRPTTAERQPLPRPAAPPAEAGAPVEVRAGGGPLLPGIGAGEVYAQSATGIFRIELGTGRITRTATPDLQEHATFLAGRGWVLAKSRWSPTGVVVRDGRPAEALAKDLDPDGFLHAGPGGRLWSEPEPSTDPTAATTLRLVGLDGRAVPGRTVTAPSAAAPCGLVADGHGAMLLANGGGVFRLEPGDPGRRTQLRLISRGTLVAVGGGRLLVQDCDHDARCRLLLVDERTRHRSSRPAAGRTLLAEGGVGIDPDVYGDSSLSPDGTRLGLLAADEDGTFRAHVIDLRSGADVVLAGAGVDSNVNRQLAWSPNGRWLLALTDHRIRGYDTEARTAGTVSVGSEQLLHLTAPGAPGW